jgi:hypothetical protein
VHFREQINKKHMHQNVGKGKQKYLTVAILCSDPV